jgi:hypothetical protein
MSDERATMSEAIGPMTKDELRRLRATVVGLEAMLDAATNALLYIGIEGPGRTEMELAAHEALRELGIDPFPSGRGGEGGDTR